VGKGEIGGGRLVGGDLLGGEWGGVTRRGGGGRKNWEVKGRGVIWDRAVGVDVECGVRKSGGWA